MFEKELDRQRIKVIAGKIFQFVEFGGKKDITIERVVNGIKKVWVEEINDILRKRKADKVETVG